MVAGLSCLIVIFQAQICQAGMEIMQITQKLCFGAFKIAFERLKT
jgi:hypothetical protein